MEDASVVHMSDCLQNLPTDYWGGFLTERRQLTKFLIELALWRQFEHNVDSLFILKVGIILDNVWVSEAWMNSNLTLYCQSEPLSLNICLQDHLDGHQKVG